MTPGGHNISVDALAAEHPQIQARHLVQATSGPDPRLEVLFPAWFDGRPPERRAPPQDVAAGTLLEAWERGEAG